MIEGIHAGIPSVRAIPVQAKTTSDPETMTFRAGFASVDFLSNLGIEMVGKLQYVRRKTLIFSAFCSSRAQLSKNDVSRHLGTFWKPQNQENLENNRANQLGFSKNPNRIFENLRHIKAGQKASERSHKVDQMAIYSRSMFPFPTRRAEEDKGGKNFKKEVNFWWSHLDVPRSCFDHNSSKSTNFSAIRLSPNRSRETATLGKLLFRP